MTLFAGTSGYGFREWVGAFYPEKTKPKDFLSHYASVFRSVEINHTFRRFPTPALAASWAESVPPGFRFAVKAHQGITHRARLRDSAAESAASFRDALAPLAERLGPILFQCPPWFRRDDEVLGRFLEALPEDGRYAFEFRHESWQSGEVEALCRSRGAALALGTADLTEDLRAPVTAAFAYVRVRRDPPYREAERRALVSLVRRASEEAETLYLYLKHDGPGLAPDAVRWIQGLGASNDPGNEGSANEDPAPPPESLAAP